MSVYYCLVRTYKGHQFGLYTEATSSIGAQNRAENLAGVEMCIAVQVMAEGLEGAV